MFFSPSELFLIHTEQSWNINRVVEHIITAPHVRERHSHLNFKRQFFTFTAEQLLRS
jgi:hypothetical protein